MRDSLILTILCLVATSFADEPDPIITLPDGKIRGHTLLSENGNVYYAFQEIPYAAPPVGELRLEPPQPPKAWNGILDTKENTKICYQQKPHYILSEDHRFKKGANTSITLSKLFGEDVIQTEDCLYLNVYTPQRPGNSSALLPVFVWIHGGGFVEWSGIFQQVGPKFFIDSDIIIVAINYRLGPLGFLTTNDGVIAGNLGLKDQNLALQWVKQNIELFGGDPEKITIAGQSAGGISVGFHLLSKKSKGLFRAAILQSGTAVVPGGYQNFSRYVAFALGKALDPSFNSDDSNDLLDLLKTVSATDLVKADISSLLPSDLNLWWAPVVESEEDEDAFITGPMDENIKNGNINQVPIIIGFNSEEGLYFLSQYTSGLIGAGVQYDEDLSILLKSTFNIKDEDGKKSGEELRKIYTNTTFQDSLQGLVSYTSDSIFTTPSIRHADLQSQYTDVFLYQFSYRGTLSGFDFQIEGVDPNGVSHSEDLFYIWDMGSNSDSSQFPEEDILTRNRILKLWSNFVKDLNPTPEEDELLQNVTWPKVTPEKLTYLDINATLEVKVDPKEYKKWKKVIDTYAIPPFYVY